MLKFEEWEVRIVAKMVQYFAVQFPRVVKTFSDEQFERRVKDYMKSRDRHWRKKDRHGRWYQDGVSDVTGHQTEAEKEREVRKAKEDRRLLGNGFVIEKLGVITHVPASQVKIYAVANGTCCGCEYSGEQETECLKRDDKKHCVHWYEVEED